MYQFSLTSADLDNFVAINSTECAKTHRIFYIVKQGLSVDNSVSVVRIATVIDLATANSVTYLGHVS